MPKYQEYEFSIHCQHRQAQRAIAKQQIIDAIEKPDAVFPDKRKKGRIVYVKRIHANQQLKVIVKEVKNGQKAIIITTFASN